jgi:protein deglycase
MKNILLLLANGYETFEASVFIDIIGWNLVDGDKSTQLFSCGLTKQVNTSFSQRSLVDYLIDEIDADQFDAIAIPGGFSRFNYYDDAYSDQFIELIRKFNDKNKIIASICTAALPIGRSGILAGRNGTTYDMSHEKQEELKSYGVNVVKNQPIVVDGNIITSHNPSTAIEVAFILLEKLTDKNNADHIRRIMGFKN